MDFQITWTITAIIAVSSFLSPVVVAVINNRHHSQTLLVNFTMGVLTVPLFRKPVPLLVKLFCFVKKAHSRHFPIFILNIAESLAMCSYC